MGASFLIRPASCYSYDLASQAEHWNGSEQEVKDSGHEYDCRTLDIDPNEAVIEPVSVFDVWLCLHLQEKHCGRDWFGVSDFRRTLFSRPFDFGIPFTSMEGVCSQGFHGYQSVDPYLAQICRQAWNIETPHAPFRHSEF